MARLCAGDMVCLLGCKRSLGCEQHAWERVRLTARGSSHGLWKYLAGCQVAGLSTVRGALVGLRVAVTPSRGGSARCMGRVGTWSQRELRAIW